MGTTWRHLAPPEHHLGTMWTTIGFYLVINWRPPGNHLVTTWRPLVEQLVTPLFYIANWRPPDSWLLVERTNSNTGCPKINHFKSEQIPSSTASFHCRHHPLRIQIFERGPCCPFWFPFGYFLGRPVKFLMFLSPRVGANKVWGRMVPAFKGLGYGMLLVGIYNLSAITYIGTIRCGSMWTSIT